MIVNVYDFDKTIYDGDSTENFYFYCLKKYPNIILYLPYQFFYFILYLLKVITKTQFKEKFYIFLRSVKNIDDDIQLFWNINISKIKDWYYQNHKENDIVISASPEFLLEPICKRLNINCLIASRVDKHSGKYSGENCYGEEKVNRLNIKKPKTQINEFYSDSFSDQPLADKAKISFIVKGNNIYRWNEFKQGEKIFK